MASGTRIWWGRARTIMRTIRGRSTTTSSRSVSADRSSKTGSSSSSTMRGTRPRSRERRSPPIPEVKRRSATRREFSRAILMRCRRSLPQSSDITPDRTRGIISTRPENGTWPSSTSTLTRATSSRSAIIVWIRRPTSSFRIRTHSASAPVAATTSA